MTNFGWWGELVQRESGGAKFLCQICYESKPVEEAYTDSDGQKWDVCILCQALDDRTLALRDVELMRKGLMAVAAADDEDMEDVTLAQVLAAVRRNWPKGAK